MKKKINKEGKGGAGYRSYMSYLVECATIIQGTIKIQRNSEPLSKASVFDTLHYFVPHFFSYCTAEGCPPRQGIEKRSQNRQKTNKQKKRVCIFFFLHNAVLSFLRYLHTLYFRIMFYCSYGEVVLNDSNIKH